MRKVPAGLAGLALATALACDGGAERPRGAAGRLQGDDAQPRAVVDDLPNPRGEATRAAKGGDLGRDRGPREGGEERREQVVKVGEQARRGEGRPARPRTSTSNSSGRRPTDLRRAGGVRQPARPQLS